MTYFKNLHKDRKAFTMIELVFVIVVIGILASLALPRIDRDIRQEAGDNILSAIRYTQFLALNDNKTDPFTLNDDWQKSLWQIRFTGTTAISYTIGSNMDYAAGGTNIDKKESAIDPFNGKYMYNNAPSSPQEDESPNIFISKKFGINTVTFNNCKGTQNTSAKHIAFDHLGRPHRGISNNGSNDYRTYVNNGDCVINFGFEDSSISPLIVTIEQETGHAFIVGEPDS